LEACLQEIVTHRRLFNYGLCAETLLRIFLNHPDKTLIVAARQYQRFVLHSLADYFKISHQTINYGGRDIYAGCGCCVIGFTPYKGIQFTIEDKSLKYASETFVWMRLEP